MSITKRAAILGFGSLWRISYFLYDGQIPPVEVAAVFGLGVSIGGGVNRLWPPISGDFRMNGCSEFRN